MVRVSRQAYIAWNPEKPGGGIGVETSPKVYLVTWGSQWNGNDLRRGFDRAELPVGSRRELVAQLGHALLPERAPEHLLLQWWAWISSGQGVREHPTLDRNVLGSVALEQRLQRRLRRLPFSPTDVL